MKQKIYITLFVLLGALLGFILHALIEIAVIGWLIADWDKRTFGLNYQQLMVVHWIFAASLLVLGGYWGYRSALRWRQILYVQKKYKRT